MKKLLVLLASLSLLVASCGGGSGSTAQPTSTETKVATEAATTSVMEATGDSVLPAILGGFAGTTSVKSETHPVDYLGDCFTSTGEMSGTFTVTGEATATCTGTDASWSCTDVVAPITIVFTNCAKYLDRSGTTYNVLLNGTATTTARGSVSGTMVAPAGASPVLKISGPVPTAIDMSGEMEGTVTITGDVSGTADLGEVTYSATGNPSTDELTLGCDGTAEVTITDQPLEICTVADDCKGCTE